MRVLLTGGGGFVGRTLRALISQEQASVETVSLGYRTDATHTIHAPSEIGSVLAAARPDIVLHLAGASFSSPPDVLERINVSYAASLLQGVLENKLNCPVVLFGSAAEYGEVDGAELPVVETRACSPLSTYGKSKLAQTRLAMDYYRQGVRTVVVRPFNIIGPGMPPRMLLHDLVLRLHAVKNRTGRQILELMTPEATRDFIDVRDVALQVWRIARNPDSSGQVVNICTGRETTVKDTFYAVAQALGVDAAFVEKPANRPGALRSVGSVKKMVLLSGSAPEYSFTQSVSDGVASMYASGELS